MWPKIRRIPPSTLQDLHTLLKTGINPHTSGGSKASLLQWAPYFKLAAEGHMIMQTDVPPRI